MAQHLTDALVKRLPAPDKGNRVTYDDGLPGFGVRVTAAGHRAFIFNYVVRTSGRERRFTLGSTASWRVTAARAEARRLKQLVERGGDPLADIEEARAAPTVAELCDRFQQEHVSRKRASTQGDYQRMLRIYVRPHFGVHTKVADVRFEDIDALHRKVSKEGHTYRANRLVAMLSKMFSLAVRWNMRTDNPCKGIERNTEFSRRRYLSSEELARLLVALNAHPDRQIANIVRMLLLTGARRGEVLSAKWADIDLTKGVWSKPAASTKQQQNHTVPLSAPVRQLLSEIQAAQKAKHRVLGTYVFPGLGNTGHVVEIKKGWASICRSAGISGLRIHDLRHSFASQLASGGASLLLIGSLLGHSSPTTTHRYSHLFDDPLRKAVERVGATVTAAGQPAKEPVDLKPHRR
jgi:integrase